MSENHNSVEAAEESVPIMAFFAPSQETPKPLGDFPTATAHMYEIYLQSFSARTEKYNTFIASCNYLYENTFGESDDVHIFQSIAHAIGIAHEGMMVDIEVMEEKLLMGTIEDEAGELAGIGGSSVVAVPEEPVFEAEEAVVMEVEEADIPGAEN